MSIFEDSCCCCCCGMFQKLDKNSREVQEDLLSVTPQCFKLPDSPKSKVNMIICNNNSFPVYFKLYSSNIHAIRFRPVEGCIPSGEQVIITVNQKSSQYPARQCEEVFIKAFPLLTQRSGRDHHYLKPKEIVSKEKYCIKCVCACQQSFHAEVSGADQSMLCCKYKPQCEKWERRNVYSNCKNISSGDVKENTDEKYESKEKTVKKNFQSKSSIDAHVLVRVINIGTKTKVNEMEESKPEINMKGKLDVSSEGNEEIKKRKNVESQGGNEQISVTVVQKSPKREGISVTVSPSRRTESIENNQHHSRRQDAYSKTKHECEISNGQQDTANKFKEHNCCHYCKLKQCHTQHQVPKKSCLCDVSNDCFEEVKKTWKEGHSSKDTAQLGSKDDIQSSKTCKCCAVSKVSPDGGIKTHTRMKHKRMAESTSEDEQSGVRSTRFISYPNQKIEDEKEAEKKKSDSEESSISTTSTSAKQHFRAKRNSNSKKKLKRETIGKRVEILCENIQRTVRNNFCIQMLILLIIVITVVSGIGCRRRTGWSFPCFYDFFRRY